MSEPRDNPEVAHEESDVNVRAILGFGAALLIAGVVIHVALALLFGYFSRQAETPSRVFPLSAEQEVQLPPEPRFQQNPQQDMRAFRASEEAILESYGWINKETGIARIPIEEAMKLTVERGLPARESNR
jgi:hypothetical protein